MLTLLLLSLFTIFSYQPLVLLLEAVEICSTFSCNQHWRDTIQFPFRVPLNQSNNRCGYPGFDLSCNSDGQTLLNLPSSSSNPFIVQGIDYPDQLVWVSDANNCIPKRILNLNLTLSGSPFSRGPDNIRYSFLKCSKSTNGSNRLPDGSSLVSCLGGSDYTVVAAFQSSSENKLVKEWGCEVIKRGDAPLWWPEFGYGYLPVDMSDVFLQLSWDVPGCGDCVLRGGSCGFLADSGLDVGCRLSGSGGLPKGAKYGLILGFGIPGLVCMIGLTFYISGRVRAYNQNRRRPTTEFSPSVFPQPVIVRLGLDRPTIESYPMTVLGESKRLPNNNTTTTSDATCPICLSEYQPKEILRSIPECNHYFHAQCIDEWLRMNATCPLCRKSPQKSSVIA